ncbi:hypothetical protein KR215_007312 [Drosophila sulfurigaster]|nr:hypothetical protein KR215_007312 [Drosophila sulfurigaster]
MSNSETRPSNVRQLIKMFEQLTGNGARAQARKVSERSELPVKKKVAKVLTLLINGRRVAETIAIKHEAAVEAMTKY